MLCHIYLKDCVHGQNTEGLGHFVGNLVVVTFGLKYKLLDRYPR